jgi:hypothetical protein
MKLLIIIFLSPLSVCLRCDRHPAITFDLGDRACRNRWGVDIARNAKRPKHRQAPGRRL